MAALQSSVMGRGQCMWSGATHQGPLGVWQNTGGVVTLTRSKGQHPRRRSGWGAGRADDAAFEASYVPSLQQCTSAYSVPTSTNARRHIVCQCISMHVGIPMHLSISTLGSRCNSGEDNATAGGLDGQKALHRNVSFFLKMFSCKPI